MMNIYFMGIENRPFNPEATGIDVRSEAERQREQRLVNAERVLDGFLGLQPEERILFVTDTNPANTDPGLIDIIKQKLQQRGNQFSEVIADRSLKSRDLMAMVSQHDIVWNSWDMEDTRIDWDTLIATMEERKGRMAFVPGLMADTLDEGGALTESREELDGRLARMENRLRDAAGFRIRSNYGTDLTVSLKKGERRWFKDSGAITPGRWDNLPGGEIFTTPDELGVNGVLVLPVLTEEVAPEQGVDKFVYLTIRNGKIAKIDGGASAEKLRKYLQKSSKTEVDPESVLQCAEIAFGANSKARARVSRPEGEYIDIGHPTLESEKRLGTMHFAFGSTKHGEEGTEGFTESDIHLDFVLPRNGLTVTAFYNQDDFSRQRNGTRLIDEGRWNFT